MSTAAHTSEILANAERAGLPLSAERIPALFLHLEAVVRRSRDVNLTAARSVEEALRVLLLPSLAVGAAVDPDHPPERAIDYGSGNGYPGLVVAAAWPACRVLLVERRTRKAAAIEATLRDGAFPNAEVLAIDGRDLARVRPALPGKVDLVTFRAVGEMAPLMRIAAPWLAPGGALAHWKAANMDEKEGVEAERVAAALGLSCEPARVFDPPLPSRFLVQRRAD